MAAGRSIRRTEPVLQVRPSPAVQSSPRLHGLCRCCVTPPCPQDSCVFHIHLLPDVYQRALGTRALAVHSGLFPRAGHWGVTAAENELLSFHVEVAPSLQSAALSPPRPKY